MLAVDDVVGTVVADAAEGGIATRAVAIAADGGMPRWRVTITHEGRSMTTTQYGGSPSAEGIIGALAADASRGYFDAWDDFGDDRIGFSLWERTLGSIERVFGSVDRFLELVDGSRLISA